MNQKTKTLCILGMFCALSFVLVAVFRFSIVAAAPYLSYEPKDVMIAIGGFLFGPMAAFAVSVVVAVIEMVTISSTGIIGCVMNILSSISFCCVAALVYKKKHTIAGAVIGLGLGCICMTAVMVLWNYLLTPLYVPGMTREVISGMLVPIFVPFNLVKSGLNAAITMLLYKPVVVALRSAGFVAPSKAEEEPKRYTGVMITALIVLATFVMLALVLGGKI